MNILSRTITGGIIIVLGLILIIISFFASPTFLIYSTILLIIGAFILFNKNEDKIEQINYSKIKHKKRRKK